MRIEIRKLGVRYGRHIALDDVSLAANPGEILGLLGPNGSGKSSLIKAIAGVVPASGTILFDGAPARPNVIGYLPQDFGAKAALTVLETVLLGRLGRLGLRVSDDDIAAATHALGEIGIAHLAMRDLGALSGGQRQLVFLAQALASDPDILLLDEPFSALDIRHQLEVSELLKILKEKRNLTIVIVLHNLSTALRLADRVAVLDQGRLVVQGPSRPVLSEADVRRVFHVDFDLVEHGADICNLRLLA